jgi:UDP-glucose 4-epimerase
MSSSVLVFGGSGFIGRYLMSELIKRGYSVTNADIKPADGVEGTTYQHCDIRDRETVYSLIAQNHDYVYNLAGFANLDRAVQFPVETMELNVIGNMAIMEACLKHPPKRFIYASSAYAMSNKGSFYGISKLASEKIVEEYQRRYNLPFTILRYGSVYSELPLDNNYVYWLVDEAVRTGVIRHKGDGMETREYIHASDAAKLSVDVIDSEEYANMHVILTGNERLRRVDLFDMIKEMLNGNVNVDLMEDVGHAHHYKFTPYSFDPSVSRKLVSNPHIDMGQGILECIRTAHKRNKE